MAQDIEITLSYTNFGAIGAQMAQQIDDLCAEIAFKVQGNARLLIMNPPKSGKEYKRGQRIHQASAPGEAPATDTGNLANSILVYQTNPADWIADFGAGYSAALEYGTPKMLARPYARPSVEKYRNDFNNGMKKIVGD